MFPHSDLLKLAQWEPIAPGFGRNTDDTYEMRIKPIFQNLEKLEGVEVRILTDGGLSNYASAFVHSRRNKSGDINGLYVYLSLLAPVAAVGRGTAFISGKTQGYSMIEPSAVIEFQQLSNDFEHFVWSTLEGGGFSVLSQAEVTSPLPPDVAPYEYCQNAKPWNRVFHVLFSDSD